MARVDLSGHECTFDEVEVLESDDNLKRGMHVLLPCACGTTAYEEMTHLESQRAEAEEALLNHDPRRAMFHWAPTARRKQILRYGLRPRMRATTSSAKFPIICFADSPSWAWALSGEMSHTPTGWWDLWQTELDRIQEPVVLPSSERASGIHEVRTVHRLYKRNLWLVGSRMKERDWPGPSVEVTGR